MTRRARPGRGVTALRLLPALWLLPVLWLLPGCGDTARPAVAVTLVDIPNEAAHAQVSLKLDGRDLPEQTFDQDLHAAGPQLGFKFPAGTRGALVVRVDAQDSARCFIASGAGDVTLAADQRYDVTVPLTRLLVRDCGATEAQVLVVRSGDGAGVIQSDPAGIDCGPTCGANFSPGGHVHLTALPAATSYFGGWLGACAGAAGCTLPLAGKSTVQGHFGRKVCSATHFCWEHPLPHGRLLRGLWGSGRGDVWVVGDGGTLLHYDGAFFTAQAAPVSTTLHAVWGTGPREAWAVGDGGVILRYDGATWIKEASGISNALYALWGSGSKDVWAVGDGGAILHRTTSGTWAKVTGPVLTPLRGVWGTAGGDVWAVGDGGVILRYSSLAWAVFPSSTTQNLSGVWGSGPGDVRAVGAGGVIVRWSGAGSSWSLLRTGAPAERLLAIWGARADAVYAVGDTGVTAWDGSLWGPGRAPQVALRGVWGSAATDVWAVGDGGQLLHSDGGAFAPQPTAPQRPIVSLSGGSLLDVWAVDAQGAVLHRDSTGWSQVKVPLPSGATLNAVWVTSPGDVWLVGTQGVVLRSTGPVDASAAPTFTLVTSNTTAALNAVWGAAPDDVWVVGDGGTAVHFVSGVAAPSMLTGTLNNLYAVTGSGVYGGGLTAVTAVGAAGTVVRFTGTFSAQQIAPARDLFSVWRSGAGDLWIGGNGVVLRGPAQAGGPYAALITSPVGSALYQGIWGSDPSDVWIVGSAGAQHWTGTGFAQVVVDDYSPTLSFRGVWGTDARDMWLGGQSAAAGGGTGALLRYQP